MIRISRIAMQMTVAVWLAVPLYGQAPAGGGAVAPTPAMSDTLGSPPLSTRERAEARALVALPSWAGGALVGGTAGYFLVPGGDDGRGGREFVIGATVGGILASSVSSGILAMGDRCGATDRFTRSVIGAGIGSIAALTLAYISDWFVLTVPVGTVGGAVAGSLTCPPRAAVR